MMETAKVDIRKLQLLNDRINQTIDALHQVRLSVHGLQQSGVMPSAPFMSPYLQGSPGMQGIGPMGFQHSAFGQMSPGMGGQQAPFGYGIQNPMFAQNPYFGQPWGQSLPGSFPGGGQGGFGGMSHTSPETLDPIYGQRVSQTFPFAGWGYSPFVPGQWPSGSGAF